jgi:hypothetical protein
VQRHDIAWALVAAGLFIFAYLGITGWHNSLSARRATEEAGYEPDAEDTWVEEIALDLWADNLLRDFREWLADVGAEMPALRRELETGETVLQDATAAL